MSKNIETYSKELRIVQALASRGGGIYACDNKRAAHAFRVRVHMLRRLIVQRDGWSPFDPYVFRIDPKHPSEVRMEPREEIPGTIRDLEGNPIDVEAEDHSDPIDGLVDLDFDPDAAAADLVAKLKGKADED